MCGWVDGWVCCLEVSLAGKLLVLDNLDPVTIRVEHKGNVVHAAIRKPLLPANIEALHALTCCLNVVHGNTCVKFC